MASNYQKNSIFCCADIDFVYCYFKKAAIDCQVVDFATIDKETSRYSIKCYIVKSVEQLMTDCSSKGHWNNERNFLLYKIHYWCFLAWLTTIKRLLRPPDQSLCMNTIFYLELVKILDFQSSMMQCLYELDEQTMVDLTKLLLVTINDETDSENELLIVGMIEFCLQKLCTISQNVVVIEKSRKLLQLLTNNIQNVRVRLEIVEKITTKMKSMFFDFPMKQKRFESEEKTMLCQKYSKLFNTEQNVIQFDGAIQDFLNDKLPARKMAGHTALTKNKCKTDTASSKDTNFNVMGDFICFLHELITCNWKTMFAWMSTENGDHVIAHGKKLTHHHDLLVDLYIVGKLFLKYNKKDAKKLLDILEFYIEHQTTDVEKYNIEQMMQKHEVESSKENIQGEENDLNKKLERAIFRIEETLFGNEEWFSWLLRTEELYFDQKWLECVMKHSPRFASISVSKMLLDILCILYDTSHTLVYNTLKQVVLETVSSLSFLEQIEVIIYNIQLTCAHFGSIEDRSFFISPNDQTILDETTAKLMIVMNKIVTKSDNKFHSDVLLGICNAVLISPYSTVKALVNKAMVHVGCENVICQILQKFQKIVSLDYKDDVTILIKVLDDIILNLSSTKEEEQFLKLVISLLQPISYPDFEIIEPALLSPSNVFKHIIKPKLRSTDDIEIQVTFLLNVLITILEKPSMNERHWILEEKPLGILFVLLEMCEDCVHFWEDWTYMENNDGDDDVMIRDDFALDEAWNEMNIIVKILEERMIPLLIEDFLENVNIYQNEIPLVESQLRNCDWFITFLVLPLLQQYGNMEFTIKLPACMVNYIKTSQLNISPMNDGEYQDSFCTIFFKCGALSNESLEILLKSLNDNHGDKKNNSIEDIIEALTKVLPFSTLTQWQRLLTLIKQLFQLEYIASNETTITHKDITLPRLKTTDLPEIDTFNLVVSVFENLSSKLWVTPYVWSIAIKTYILELKRVFCIETKNCAIYCHLLVQLCHLTFSIVAENVQESFIIVIFDIFNKYLSNITGLDDQHFDHIDDQHFDHIGYLKNVIKLIPQDGTRNTMINKMKQVFPNIDEIGTLYPSRKQDEI